MLSLLTTQHTALPIYKTCNSSKKDFLLRFWWKLSELILLFGAQSVALSDWLGDHSNWAFSTIRDIFRLNISNNRVMKMLDNLIAKYFSYHTQMFETFSGKIIFLIRNNWGLFYIWKWYWISEIQKITICCPVHLPGSHQQYQPLLMFIIYSLVPVKNNQNQKNRKGLNIHVLSFSICISKRTKI